MTPPSRVDIRPIGDAEVAAVAAGGAVVASVMAGHDGHRGWLYYVAVEPRTAMARWIVDKPTA